MRFLLLFIPLFTYGQTFRQGVLPGETDSVFIAPLDTMRYALSLREAADSVIVVQRVVNVNRTLAVVELNKALDLQAKMLDNSRMEGDLLRGENQRLTEAWGKAERKSDRRGRVIWITSVVAVLSTTLHFVR